MAIRKLENTTACSVFLLVLGALIVSAVSAGEGISGFMATRDGRFVDPAGRHVILHGINIVKKTTPYFSWHRPEDYARMREWGFNCIRLTISWTAIEPECGKYDENYLRHLDERIAWAKANSLYVLLDMHQDLWGEDIPGGNGAPAWATLDDGKPDGPKGAVWSDAYFTSARIHAAFDNFWANKPGPDGVGIQERFALAWQHVAKRYAGEPAIVGYDILNEPFIGSPIVLAPVHLAPVAFKLLMPEDSEGGAMSFLQFVEELQTVEGRIKAFKKLDDLAVYRPLVDAVEPLTRVFEKEKLNAMYKRVVKAIREVDQKHIVFLEPSPTANVGVRCNLDPAPGPDGQPDPLQALAAHAYDIVVDTPAAAQASDVRLKFIFDRYAETVQRLGMPILIGEWGAFYGSAEVVPVARMFVKQLEDKLASDTYWSSSKNLEETSYFPMLSRPYPAAVSGILLRYSTDPEARQFECAWTDDPAVDEPTRIYVPALWYPNGYEVELTPAGQGYNSGPVTPGSASHYLTVHSANEAVERSLAIRPKPRSS